MKSLMGLERLTAEEYQRVRLAAKMEYENGGFQEETTAMLEGIEPEHLAALVSDLAVPSVGHYPDTITPVMIAIFQDRNSRLRETIEQNRNRQFGAFRDYYTTIGEAAGIPNLSKITSLLICGRDIHPGKLDDGNSLVFPDDTGRAVYIDGRAAQKRAAIAAQLTIYSKFADPEEIMNFDIRVHEEILTRKKAAS